MLRDIDFQEVKEHYAERERTHQELNIFIRRKKVEQYVKLALGISHPLGNFSASDHNLGFPIIKESGMDTVFEFGEKILNITTDKELLELIYKRANIPYLKIGVGSEMAAMLKPEVFWVANTRTIWAHLVLESKSFPRANKALKLMNSQDEQSEMAYAKWRQLYRAVKKSLAEIAKRGAIEAKKAKVTPGKHEYLWADAICNQLYELKSSRS